MIPRSRLPFLFALALVCVMLAACSSEPAPSTSSSEGRQAAGEPAGDLASFEGMVAAAKGTTVRFYMWGGSSAINAWVDGYVAGEMRARYDVDLVRVAMDAPVFVNKLVTEKLAGKTEGSIDLVWINGENFKNAREADVLLGPINHALPNMAHLDAATAATDFGYPTDGYEAPYGKAYFVLEYDMARTPEPPRSFPALLTWVKAHPGRFSYPQPPDFTGSAFIRLAFSALTGGHEQYMQGFDADLYTRNAPKLWAFLKELKPYLWQEGRAYPKDSAALDTLFARGEVDFSMSYHPPHAQSLIHTGAYPETVRTTYFEEGALSNTHFTAVPFNAPNKAGALLLANLLLDPATQLHKFKPENWGDFPAIDLATVSEAERAAFAAVDLGAATQPPATLAAHAVPEIPAAYLERLETDWENELLH